MQNTYVWVLAIDETFHRLFSRASLAAQYVANSYPSESLRWGTPSFMVYTAEGSHRFRIEQHKVQD